MPTLIAANTQLTKKQPLSVEVSGYILTHTYRSPAIALFDAPQPRDKHDDDAVAAAKALKTIRDNDVSYDELRRELGL